MESNTGLGKKKIKETPNKQIKSGVAKTGASGFQKGNIFRLKISGIIDLTGRHQ